MLDICIKLNPYNFESYSKKGIFIILNVLAEILSEKLKNYEESLLIYRKYT